MNIAKESSLKSLFLFLPLISGRDNVTPLFFSLWSFSLKNVIEGNWQNNAAATVEGCSGDEACGERKKESEIIMSVCLTGHRLPAVVFLFFFAADAAAGCLERRLSASLCDPLTPSAAERSLTSLLDFVRNYKPLVKLMSCVHKQVGVRLEIQTRWQKHLRGNLPFSAVSGPRLLLFVVMLQRDTYINVMLPVSRQKKLHLNTMQRLQPTDR